METAIVDNIKTCLDNFKTFNNNERKQIEENISELFHEYINNNTISICYPSFDKDLTKYIYTNIIESVKNICKKSDRYRIRKKIKKIIDKTKKYAYTKIIPYRSYKNSFIRNIEQNLDHLENKITFLQDIPQPQQRTDDWYIFRHNLLTASSIWKVLGSDSCYNGLIYEKCKPYTLHKSAPLDSPLHWGQKYEPVSILLYEHLYKTKIEDFGCIRHPKYPFIGASPDGINVDKNNSRYARMLEIKNIVNREINGIPKMEYWIQMQVQMETCDLNECDFLETKFVEYDSYNDFIEDGNFTTTNDNKLKGIILMFNKNNNTFYEYAPLYIDESTYNKWEESMFNKNSDSLWIQTIYWKLEKYSNVLVLRNKLWFKEAVKKFEAAWNTIIKERVEGFEHRAPKKRKIISESSSKCLINVEKLHSTSGPNP
tara:strand:- start:5505 stop:6785 length:1281 start_codon:yes stop_codon:yes gene_type:complete